MIRNQVVPVFGSPLITKTALYFASPVPACRPFRLCGVRGDATGVGGSASADAALPGDVPAPLLPLAGASAAAVTGGGWSNVFDIEESRSFNKSFKLFGPATRALPAFIRKAAEMVNVKKKGGGVRSSTQKIRQVDAYRLKVKRDG